MLQFDVLAKRQLAERVLALLANEPDPSDTTFRQMISRAVAERYSGSRLSLLERQNIAEQLFNVLRGLDILQSFMDDPAVTEIMVNGPDQIFIERAGQIQKTELSFDNRQHLTEVISNFFSKANCLLNESQPVANVCLPGGSRAHAVLPPVAPDGPVLSIRKFTGIKP